MELEKLEIRCSQAPAPPVSVFSRREGVERGKGRGRDTHTHTHKVAYCWPDKWSPIALAVVGGYDPGQSHMDVLAQCLELQ